MPKKGKSAKYEEPVVNKTEQDLSGLITSYNKTNEADARKFKKLVGQLHRCDSLPNILPEAPLKGSLFPQSYSVHFQNEPPPVLEGYPPPMVLENAPDDIQEAKKAFKDYKPDPTSKLSEDFFDDAADLLDEVEKNDGVASRRLGGVMKSLAAAQLKHGFTCPVLEANDDDKYHLIRGAKPKLGAIMAFNKPKRREEIKVQKTEQAQASTKRRNVLILVAVVVILIIGATVPVVLLMTASSDESDGEGSSSTSNTEDQKVGEGTSSTTLTTEGQDTAILTPEGHDPDDFKLFAKCVEGKTASEEQQNSVDHPTHTHSTEPRPPLPSSEPTLPTTGPKSRSDEPKPPTEEPKPPTEEPKPPTEEPKTASTDSPIPSKHVYNGEIRIQPVSLININLCCSYHIPGTTLPKTSDPPKALYTFMKYYVETITTVLGRIGWSDVHFWVSLVDDNCSKSATHCSQAYLNFNIRLDEKVHMPHLVWWGIDFNDERNSKSQVLSFVKKVVLPQLLKRDLGCTVSDQDERLFLQEEPDFLNYWKYGVHYQREIGAQKPPVNTRYVKGKYKKDMLKQQ